LLRDFNVVLENTLEPIYLQVRISGDSNNREKNAHALVEGEWLLEQEISTQQSQAKFQVSNHVVANILSQGI